VLEVGERGQGGEARVRRAATLRSNAQRHGIPVCPVFDGEATVYVDIAPEYATARNIGAGPRVAVLMDEYHDDWNLLKRVLLRCRAEAVSGEEQDRAWDRIREKYPQYESVGWEPRLTLALRIYDWNQEGVAEG
jgi:hypothetical protein